jgi:hypothetical protein|tara:strand:- start:2172 stop:2696 length:525 start_codon:yes stop_codon:yes gene_type:complete
MGYRSQVAGCFSVDRVSKLDEQGKSYSYYDKAKFKEMVGFIKLSRFYELWNTKPDDESFGWEDGYFVLYGSDWKWYPDYSDVQAWNELWYSMRQVEGISGYFCRVGEESDDIEEHNFGDDPCYEFFHTYSALSFDGNDFLGKRQTDDEEEQGEQASTNQEEKPCGSSVADTTQA